MKSLLLLVTFIVSSSLSAHGLEDVMSDMNKNLKIVVSDVKAKDLTDSTLRSAVTLEFLATKAKDLEPHMASELPANERAKFIAAYKERIGELLVLLNKLTFSILNDDNKEAVSLLADVKKLKISGHDDFKGDDH